MGFLTLAALMLGAGIAHAQAPAPRPCVEERDQLRVLSRMLGDQRGSLELQYAEALAQLQRALAENAKMKADKAKPEPNP